MMLKGLTAQYLLRKTFKVKKGHRVLVHAGAGGVGQILCQWANGLGAKVIATVGSPDKAKIAEAAGARHTILYREENFVERVRELTKGKLCDVVYDGVGRATFPASLDCLAPFGMFVSFGSASGPIEAFDIGLLALKGSLYATRPSLFTHIARRRDYEEMVDDLAPCGEAGLRVSRRTGAVSAGRCGQGACRARITRHQRLHGSNSMISPYWTARKAALQQQTRHVLQFDH